MGLGQLYPQVDWTYELQALGVNADISGAPTILVGPSEEVYFAFSAKGAVGILPAVSQYQIVIGCVSASGTLQWLFRDPQLVSTATDSQPVLVLGSDGEMYVAFTTTGSVPGRTNAALLPSFCGGCGTFAGPEDLVVARINGTTAGTPVVAWVIQDISINSCSREQGARILFDSYANRLLLAYTTTGSTICAARVGSPNVVIASLDPITGGLSWAHQAANLNSSGQNGPPSLAVDAAGGIYAAYTVTAQVSGGGTFVGSQQVEIVKLVAGGSPFAVTREWILSATTQINPSAVSVSATPSLTVDIIRNRLYVAFTTTGIVPGGSIPTPAPVSNLVVASVQTTGQLNWMQETPFFNEPQYRYSHIFSPAVTLDVNGNLYVAARCTQVSTGQGMITVFKLNADTGISGWAFQNGVLYRAYLPAINSADSPNTAFRVGADYSPPAIGIRSGHLYVAFVNQDSNQFQLVALSQIHRYTDITAFQYMRDVTSICCK